MKGGDRRLQQAVAVAASVEEQTQHVDAQRAEIESPLLCFISSQYEVLKMNQTKAATCLGNQVTALLFGFKDSESIICSYSTKETAL